MTQISTISVQLSNGDTIFFNIALQEVTWLSRCGCDRGSFVAFEKALEQELLRRQR